MGSSREVSAAELFNEVKYDLGRMTEATLTPIP